MELHHRDVQQAINVAITMFQERNLSIEAEEHLYALAKREEGYILKNLNTLSRKRDEVQNQIIKYEVNL